MKLPRIEEIIGVFGAQVEDGICKTADFIGAGDRDRTGDIQLGKLTFCH